MPALAERLSAAGTANALELRGVTRLFGALAALSDITLSVRPGERRAVLGSNGAGKTTLFNCITGDFLPSAGRIRFFGEDVTDFPPYERIRRGLRRTYQISLLFAGLSVIDNVYLACRGVSRGRFSLLRPGRNEALMQSARDLTEAMHLTDVRDRRVGELAHGQQRQLEIALALAGRAALYPVRRTRRRPLAGRTAGADRDPDVAAGAYRVHHHRARHGRGVAGR